MSFSKKEVRISDVFRYNPLPDTHAGFVRIKKQFKPSFKMASDNPVGIEVEIERVYSTSGITSMQMSDGSSFLWSNVDDGSLRNSGREFVSTPLRGEDIEFALTSLFTNLVKNPRTKGYEFTDRTSVHVHVNVREMSLKEIQNFILLYIIVEPVLYNFCGGKRHKNVFCVPLNQTNLNAELYQFFTKRNIPNFSGLVGAWKKYVGFNISPIANYGTVEFRHMVGTDDIKKLLTWVNLLLKLHKYAQQSLYLETKRRALSLNTSSEYMIFLEDIFGEDSKLLYYDNFEKHMEEMVLFLKQCFSPAVTSPQEALTNEDVVNVALSIRDADKNSKLLTKLGGFHADKKARAMGNLAGDVGGNLVELPF